MIEEILNINKFKSEEWIKNNYPDLHFLILNYSNLDISWKEKAFIYISKLNSSPKCVCGEFRKFISFNKGYRKFCSVKCASNSPDTKNKIKQTNIEKWGVDSPMKVKSIKNSQQKTVFDKYGVINISQYDDIKNKIKKQNLEKWGVEYNSQRPEVKLILQDALNKNRNKINEVLNKKINDEVNKKIEDFNITLIKTSNSMYEMICEFDHEFSIHKTTLNDRLYNKNTICTVCNPINHESDAQKQLYDFIKNNYNGVIIENCRSVVSKELDVFIPELNLAFEYNGLYWHSDVYKDDSYHLNKTEICENIGIHLIHIWEDDWLFKNNIVKSRILNLLGKSTRIGARKCDIKYLDKKETKIFLEENHIQGYVISKINIGLIYEGRIVSIMTFGNLRRPLGQKVKQNNWELLRFCNELNTTVIGGASKLFKHFINNHEIETVLSYADRCWSIGKLYKKIGFDLIGMTKQNYYYIKKGIRENRFGYRKDVLVSNNYDKNLTEKEIMKLRGYNRIYDSGSLKFLYKV